MVDKFDRHRDGPVGRLSQLDLALEDLKAVQPYDPGRPCEIRIELNTTEAADEYRRKPGVDLVVDAAGTESTRRIALDLLSPAGTAVFIALE